MSWFSEFDAVFFVTVFTIFAGLCKFGFDKCVESKCESFSLCWQFIQVNRRVDLEIQRDLRKLELEQLHPSSVNSTAQISNSQV